MPVRSPLLSRRSFPPRRPSRRKIRAARRSEAVPFFWRVVDHRLTGPDGAKAQGRLNGFVPPAPLLSWWKLALDARDIPWILTGHGSSSRLFVPALYEDMARQELAAVTAESFRGHPAPLPLKSNLHWTLAVLLLFLLWQGFVAGWWLKPEALQGAGLYHWIENWRHLGALDVGAVLRQHEWWRCTTALTLHADAHHFFGNLLFGGMLLALAARRLGLGVALLLTLCAGTLGNVCNALYRPDYHVSLGFSTAVFALAGILGADTALREGLARGLWRKALLPLGAALALVALLGTEGEETDYAAHLFGLASGIVLGLGVSYILRSSSLLRPALQFVCGSAALFLPVLAWFAAL